MTINIGLVTSEGLILGCDSISSTTRAMIDPFGGNVEPATDSDGNDILDADGNKVVSIKPTNATRVVTSVFSGAKKMFPIYEENGVTVAAVGSGMGKLLDRSLNGLAQDFVFHSKGRAKPFANVLPVVKAFLRFVRSEYERHYADIGLPEQYWSPLNFLIGGYGKNDKFPSLYRVTVQSNSIDKHFSGANNDCGMAWGGQSESVECLINGYTFELKQRVNKEFEEILNFYRNQMETELSSVFTQIIDKFGSEALDGITINLPDTPANLPNWDGDVFTIDYANLPLQDAIDLVSAMVNSQSGLQKFSTSIATVGGRTHVGVVEKGEKLNMLDEAPLVHRHTGYQDV